MCACVLTIAFHCGKSGTNSPQSLRCYPHSVPGKRLTETTPQILGGFIGELRLFTSPLAQAAKEARAAGFASENMTLNKPLGEGS